jgi:hypothetical protein
MAMELAFGQEDSGTKPLPSKLPSNAKIESTSFFFA